MRRMLLSLNGYQVLSVGGSAADLAGLDTPASSVAYILDLATGVWTGTSTPMSQARVMGNAILLPNSQVLVLNGAGTGMMHSCFVESSM